MEDLPVIKERINGIFDTMVALEAYRKALSEPSPALNYHDDAYPKLPACLDRRPEPSLAEAA